METARISHLLAELPGDLIADAELATDLGVDAAHVAALSRGRPRYFAPDGIGPADLAANAARRVLESSGTHASDLGLIVFATNTPDLTFPGSACLLQALLEAETVGCLDVRCQCCGFLVAIELARRFIGTGTYDRILVAAGEVPSHQNRFDGVDPDLTCLTGDGAAVVLMEAGTGAGQVRALVVETDGRLHQLLWCEYPASRHFEGAGIARGRRITREVMDEGRIYPRADFPGLRQAAFANVPRVFEQALAQAELEGVDVLVVRHVMPDVEDDLAETLSPRAGRVVNSDLLYTYAASLPLALAAVVKEGRVARGETVALVTAGSGASWGTAIVEV